MYNKLIELEILFLSKYDEINEEDRELIRKTINFFNKQLGEE